ncbi:MAG: hypothetical protein HQM14_05925 [SAR324 cluster bacterium]|nr:hypothetical protein [SAR324 cluster bacterium]
MKIWTIFFIVFLLCSGCYTTNYYTDTEPLRDSYDGETSHGSVIFAAIELDHPTQLRPLCPSGVSRLEMEQTFTDGLIHYFSFGLYSTQTTRVWCKRRYQE